jgi:hypothetical protein
VSRLIRAGWEASAPEVDGSAPECCPNLRRILTTRCKSRSDIWQCHHFVTCLTCLTGKNACPTEEFLQIRTPPALELLLSD